MSLINQRIAFIFCILGGVFILTSCSNTTVPPSKPIPKPASRHLAARAAVGGAAGATVGALVSHDPVVGGVVGGAVGAGIGLASGMTSANPPTCLQAYGVQYINLHGRLIILIPTPLLFENNSAELKLIAPKILGPIADYLKEYPDANIHISGNASPIIDYSWYDKTRISLQRATKVAGYFWKEGVNKGCHRKLTFTSNGADYPIATNKKIAGMAENRRIQIVVYPKNLTPYPNGTPPDTQNYRW